MKLLINCPSSHQVLFWPLLPPSLNKKLCQNDGVCPSFLLSFLSLGWNCLSEDTVLFRRATQLRPPLGCGLKPALPAKAGEETSVTRGPRGPKPPVHWRSSDRPCSGRTCKSRHPAPVPTLPGFRASRDPQVQPSGLALVQAWGKGNFLFSAFLEESERPLKQLLYLRVGWEHFIYFFTRWDRGGRQGGNKGFLPVLTCELLKFA